MVLRLSFGRRVHWSSNARNAVQCLQIPDDSLHDLIFPLETFKSSILKMFSTVSPGRQFVDVGVNIGQTMLEVFSQNSEVEYFGFEPNPQAFSCLQQLAQALNINANLFPWACSTTSEPASFYASSSQDCSATLLPEIRPNTYVDCNSSHIASYPLDLSLNRFQLSSCFIMKIDVEGFENEVLAGARQIIKSKKPLIFCEVLHAHRDSEIGLNNSRKSLLEAYLDQVGYRIFQIHLSPKDRNTFQGISEIKQFPRDFLWKDGPHTCDFLFAPKELDIPVR
mgnify:CR=1 FL=1